MLRYWRSAPMPPVSSTLPDPAELPSFVYAPGDTIAGKYALEELLGSGGMGAVFRARNTVIDMPVAIKVIRADLDRNLLSGRLLQEARGAAKLSHPAIVRVFDVGTTALGDPFIVMELLNGMSLAAVLEREARLTSARAVQLLLPIADALALAHSKGLVHRDVKPDNVFIADDEEGQLQPKLVDFGIVKHEQKTGDSQLTQVGAVLGSPDYMSPEQARGLDSIDLRSDVWSFSVMLYEVITGRTPFESTNYNALLRMIVETEPPSLRELKAADGELSAIVSKGMSKERGARWASMGQMGRALASWLHDQGITEDACGVSLEARWLSRPTDPTSPGRSSRSSSPDSWPEPPSGVRYVSGQLGRAPTVEVGRSAGTPVSLAKTSFGLSASKRQLYLAVAGVIAIVALSLVWLSLRPPATRGAASAMPSAPAAAVVEARAEPPVSPTPTPVPNAAVSAQPVAPQPSAAQPVAAQPIAQPAPAKPQKSAPQKPRPAASSAPAPGSDLISPY
jgi:serine/threonine protein kinase